MSEHSHGHFRDLKRAIIRANGGIVAIEPGAAEKFAMLAASAMRGDRVVDEAFAALSAPGAKSADYFGDSNVVTTPGRGRRIALVSFRGLVTYDIEMQPYAASTKQLAATMRELGADSSVGEIILLVDSPGGTVVGLPEAADAVYAARRAKKVTAVVEILCASAAYYVASQASEIVLMPSAIGAGSIGVRTMHVDCSAANEQAGIKVTHLYAGKYKVEANNDESLSDEARARIQSEVDVLYEEFIRAVARGRGVDTKTVLANYGQGRVLRPAEAKRVGMVDRLEVPDAAISRILANGSKGPGGSRAAQVELLKLRLELDGA